MEIRHCSFQFLQFEIETVTIFGLITIVAKIVAKIIPTFINNPNEFRQKEENSPGIIVQYLRPNSVVDTC